MPGKYIYRYHVGIRFWQLVKHLVHTFIVTVILIFCISLYVGGEMSDPHRNYSNEAIMNTLFVITAIIFLFAFTFGISKALRNTVHQRSYFYVDLHQLIHFFDMDERIFKRDEIGVIEVMQNCILIYNDKQVEIYAATFNDDPRIIYDGLKQYHYQVEANFEKSFYGKEINI